MYYCACCGQYFDASGRKLTKSDALVRLLTIDKPTSSRLFGDLKLQPVPSTKSSGKRTDAPLDMGQYRDKNGKVYYDWERYLREQDKIMQDAQFMGMFGTGPLLNGMAGEANRYGGSLGYPDVPDSLSTPSMPYFEDRYTYKDPLDKLLDKILGTRK